MVAPMVGPETMPSRIASRPLSRVNSARARENAMLLCWICVVGWPLAATCCSLSSPRMTKSRTLISPSWGC